MRSRFWRRFSSRSNAAASSSFENESLPASSLGRSSGVMVLKSHTPSRSIWPSGVLRFPVFAVADGLACRAMSGARDSNATEAIATSAPAAKHRARIEPSLSLSSVESSAPWTCRAAARHSCTLGHEHPDHAVLPRGEEQLAVATAAKVQIGTGHRGAHRLLDQLSKRDVGAIAASIAQEQLNFLDRRHGLRNPIVCLLHRGSVGRKHTASSNVAEHELPAQCGYAAVVRKPTGYGLSFTVVVNRHRIREPVLLAALQYVGRKRVQLVESAAGPGDAVLPISFTLHPAVVLAVADDVGLFDVVHANVGREQRAVGHIPGQPVGVSKTVGVDLAQCL